MTRRRPKPKIVVRVPSEVCLFFFKLLKKGYLLTILKYSTKGKWRETWSNIAFLKSTRSLRHYKVRIPFFKKIQDWILKSKNGICASFLNRSIQDFSDHGESRWSQRNRRIQSGSRFFVVYETRTMTPTNFLYFHCIPRHVCREILLTEHISRTIANLVGKI